MTGVAEQPNVYLAQFPEFAQAKNGQPWLHRIRKSAIERFAELGFPTTHDEEWRFTNVAPIARENFQAPAGNADGLTKAGLDTLLFADPQACRLVFVNGRYAPGLSTAGVLPAGVQAGSLARALAEEPEAVEQHLARHAAFEQQAFVALNTAFLEDGGFVRVPKGTVVERPIHLVFAAAAGAQPAIVHPRNLIVVGRESQLTVIESYIGLGDQVYFTNAVTEIVGGENSVVDHYKLQMEQNQAFHVATLQAQEGRGANFTSHSISLGGALVRNDANAVLSEGTEVTLNGFYLVAGRQHVDNHISVDHARPHGISHELYKGILDGRSGAVFNGKILVRKDAQKTDAKQTNKNLMLSEDAVINTKPELQIFADDVRCTHGATIGQLDQESIFYLQSRGIGKEEARNLLTYAFARDVIDRIKVAPMREKLEQVLFERLHDNRQ
jgi:Fe-S cluster assembly protein SufD